MKTLIINLVLKPFTKKAEAIAAHAVLFVVLYVGAWLPQHVAPQFAALYDPAKAAAVLWGLLNALANVLANRFHGNAFADALLSFQDAMNAQGVPQIPIERAQPVTQPAEFKPGPQEKRIW